MISGGDHSTRSLLHRRVSSWAEAVSVINQEENSALSSFDEHEPNNENSNNDNDLTQPLLLLPPGLEYEPQVDEDAASIASRRRKGFKLWLVCFLMVISGVSTVVLAKLQSLPMYNYPTVLNMYANFMYILVSFCYILPVAYFGWFHDTIPWRHLQISKKPFVVMGFLDALSAALQVLASVYLPGTLLILLPQAAIPLSMLASRLVLRERFTKRQYIGAAVVFLGILVVLFPVLTHHASPEYSCQAVGGGGISGDYDTYCALCEMETTEEDCLSHVVKVEEEGGEGPSRTVSFARLLMENQHDNNSNSSTAIHDDDKDDDNDSYYCKWISRDEMLRNDDVLTFVWSLVMVASCIPMVFSCVYKQVALQVELDPIFINGWVSLFQFLFGLPLVIPAGLVSSPKVKPLEVPKNWLNGMACLFAQSNSVGSGCHPDDCSQAALWVHLYLLSSVVFTLSMMFVLKYGSSSLMYLGLTVVVPLGHLVFSLHSPSSVGIFDILGLIVLVAGLVLYRFGHKGGSEAAASAPGDANGGAAAATTAAGAANEMEEKDGFLEFLREPFMLIGDI